MRQAQHVMNKEKGVYPVNPHPAANDPLRHQELITHSGENMKKKDNFGRTESLRKRLRLRKYIE